jgi:hypothetical protein
VVHQKNNTQIDVRQRIACRIPQDLLDLLNAIAKAFQSPFATTKSLIDHIVDASLAERPWKSNPWPDLRPRRAVDYSGVPTGYIDYAAKVPESVVRAIKGAVDEGAAVSIPSYMLLSILWWIAFRHDNPNTHTQLRNVQRKYELPYPFDATTTKHDDAPTWVPTPGADEGKTKPDTRSIPPINEVMLIGLDAAADLRNFGCAIGKCLPGQNPRIELLREWLLINEDGLARLASELRNSSRCLIAIDSPLGWPRPMGVALENHLAGQSIPGEANLFFRRLTDRKVYERTGKLPLDVGADRIARAALQALHVLNKLASASGKPVRLAWNPADVEPGFLNVVEVYPAATLKVNGLPNSGYKKDEQREQRKVIADGVQWDLNGIHRLIDKSDDMFDAALCLIAGRDFLTGSARSPELLESPVARKEGWIWVRDAT